MVVKKLGISLVLIIVLITVPLGFSEPLRVQLEQGIETDKIQCDNPNHVLVQRTNGNFACVSEKSAERTGWKILYDSVKEIVNPITNDILSNSTNYWMPNPDEDIEKFAKKFAAAAGVTLSDPYVSLSINHLGANMRLADSDIDATKSEKFVRDFMDYMGFEFEEKDFHEHPNFGSREFPNDRERYLISKENISFITFEFYHYEEEWYEGEYYDASTDARITFTGWTNHPELIVYSLSEDKALEYATEFSNDLKRNLNLLEGYDEYEDYGCKLQKEANPEYPLKININKKVLKGVPYYVSEVGLCISYVHEAVGMGMFSRLMLHQDAVNGTDIFIVHGPSGE